MIAKIRAAAKFVAALLTVLTTAGVGLIPGEYIGWVQLVIALIGAGVVYQVSNGSPAGTAEVAE